MSSGRVGPVPFVLVVELWCFQRYFRCCVVIGAVATVVEVCYTDGVCGFSAGACAVGGLGTPQKGTTLGLGTSPKTLKEISSSEFVNLACNQILRGGETQQGFLALTEKTVQTILDRLCVRLSSNLVEL